eukprot:gene10538-21975_t
MNYILACEHAEMNPLRRNTMEDVHRVVPNLDGDATTSYFAVYDGHGGRQIVDFLETALEKNIAIELKQPDNATVLERLARAFLITDMQSRQHNLTTSGATAVSALLCSTPVGKTIYVANVGDSRAVLCHKAGPQCGEGNHNRYMALRMSYDHRAEDEGEQKRIKDAGGFIARGRVLGILAVSRSFGDHGMKDFVSASPYLSQVDLRDYGGDCPFLILACDGVWDVLTDQEAVDLIYERYYSSGPFENAANLLVHTALDRGSADNITAIVVFL